MFPAYALRDTVINKNDRICQFAIVENQPEIKFVLVDKLEGGGIVEDLEAQENKMHLKYEVPNFDGKNIPVIEVARLMGKDQQFIRQGIIRGILPIGLAFKKTINDSKWGTEKESTQYDFYISPKLLWEYTGINYNKIEK